jgi:hypothetical protein
MALAAISQEEKIQKVVVSSQGHACYLVAL